MKNARKLALHAWTLDTTPLADFLRVARETGWDAVELRRLDFTRAAEHGESASAMIDLVKGSGLPVACVGVEYGWMWTRGAGRARLLSVFAEQCERARRLGAALLMSPVDRGRGDPAEAAASVREVGGLGARHGLRLGVGWSWQGERVNRRAAVRVG